jgi:hypothetical protein
MTLREELRARLASEAQVVSNLNERIEGRSQTSSSAIALIISVLALGVSANVDLAATIREKGLLGWGILSFCLLLLAFVCAVAVSIGGEITLRTADSYKATLLEATDKELEDDWDAMQSEIDALLVEQYRQAVARLTWRVKAHHAALIFLGFALGVLGFMTFVVTK